MYIVPFILYWRVESDLLLSFNQQSESSRWSSLLTYAQPDMEFGLLRPAPFGRPRPPVQLDWMSALCSTAELTVKR